MKEIFKDVSLFSEELQSELPNVYVFGQSALKIQNYKKILHYSPKEMIFLLDKQLLIIKGEGLNMDYFNEDELGVHGHIVSITYQGG